MYLKYMNCETSWQVDMHCSFGEREASFYKCIRTRGIFYLGTWDFSNTFRNYKILVGLRLEKNPMLVGWGNLYARDHHSTPEVKEVYFSP